MTPAAPRKKRSTGGSARGEVLVAIMNSPRDFALLRDELWYRIPVDSRPKRWPPQWLAFYLTQKLGKEAYSVPYYGQVSAIEEVRRTELFPGEIQNPKSDKTYYRLRLERLERLPTPIRSRSGRRIVFISTTWQKLQHAVEINDLFDDSPLEDSLWKALKTERIRAERQWLVTVAEGSFALDFAVFCQNGQIDVETDGDTYHKGRSEADNNRNNALEAGRWDVLRFNGHQIREKVNTHCLEMITRTITRLGGLKNDGPVPRRFLHSASGSAQQLSLFGHMQSDDEDEW